MGGTSNVFANVYGKGCDGVYWFVTRVCIVKRRECETSKSIRQHSAQNCIPSDFEVAIAVATPRMLL